MARSRSMTTIDSEIQKLETELAKVQQKYDAIAARLQAVRKQKREAEMKQIMEAYMQSGKSFSEVMIFLGG